MGLPPPVQIWSFSKIPWFPSSCWMSLWSKDSCYPNWLGRWIWETKLFLCKSWDISSCILPHAHQQNGAAERKHRDIVEVGFSLLAHAHMPLKYWDEAFLTATYLINRTPSRVLNYLTPLEILFKTKPDYSSLRTFGCACQPNLRPYNKTKLEFHSKQCTFLGYSNLCKGFKWLDVSQGRSTSLVMLSLMRMFFPSQISN